MTVIQIVPMARKSLMHLKNDVADEIAAQLLDGARLIYRKEFQPSPGVFCATLKFIKEIAE